MQTLRLNNVAVGKSFSQEDPATCELESISGEGAVSTIFVISSPLFL